ncbi:hypothetical protein DITRI_Ditri17bG0055900 [Diplodiscus trichospermus]
MGAFLADSYMGRFLTIGLGSVCSFLGVTFLWLTALITQAMPPPCDQLTRSCKTATAGQLGILVCALFFKSIGAGGIRPCSMPFGVDQLSNHSEKTLESYFSWYYAAASLGGSLGGIWSLRKSNVSRLLATLAFYIASPLYVKRKATTSLFTGFVQVLAASYKSRNHPFPSQKSGYHHGKGSEITVPSDKFRFLNKACIIRNAEQEIGPDGLTLDP